MIQWLLAINKGYRVGLYCSDVSGAFDRVSRARLLEKLKAKDIHPKVLRLLESWLDTRTAEVIVDGCASDPMVLDNSVFQGTVWGPPLWNVFYEDSRIPIRSQHFIEMVFADDLNCFRSFPASCSDALIFECMRCCQESLHEWGCANQVLFDPSKESFHILHDVHGVGDCFHQLGLRFDNSLSMKDAVYELAGVGHARVTAILRLRRFHQMSCVIGFYKAQVLNKLEFATPAIYHATDFILAALDRVQDRFLEALEISQEAAIFEFKLAPLRTRRDLAMLGLLHRIVLGIAPRQFSEIVQFASRPVFPRSLRGSQHRHNRQLHDPFCGTEKRILRRSWLRLIYTYNLLPQGVVDHKSVSAFQGHLQAGVLCAVRSGLYKWDSLLSSGIYRMSVATFQGLFDAR